MQKLLDLSLADCLMANTSLRILNLGHNNFGDNALRAIGPALRLSKLSELSLVECEIRMSGARALGEGLKLNNGLVRLDLRQNPFGDVGIDLCAGVVSRGEHHVDFARTRSLPYSVGRH